MADPQYPRGLQHLANLVIAKLPEAWHQAVTRVRFIGGITGVQVLYLESESDEDQWLELPIGVLRNMVEAAQEVRADLVRTGSSECEGFVFRLAKDGKRSLDVEY